MKYEVCSNRHKMFKQQKEIYVPSHFVLLHSTMFPSALLHFVQLIKQILRYNILYNFLFYINLVVHKIRGS